LVTTSRWLLLDFSCRYKKKKAESERIKDVSSSAVFRFSLGARVQISVGRSRDLKNAEKWCYLK
jgi:hypothetical protein